jgi:hypothetical protein
VADLNQLAAHLVQQATDESEPKPANAKARAGSQGGKKGGRALLRELAAMSVDPNRALDQETEIDIWGFRDE